MISRVAVLGAGGVGGYLGARLAQAGTVDLHLLARGEHLMALRRDGLTLRSILGDTQVQVPATDDAAEVGPVDVVVFAVKATDTDEAARQLGPLVGERTAVISFQNGVDNERRIAAVVGSEHVLGGVAFIFSTIAEPGVIHHTGGAARFVFGEMDGRVTPRATKFLDECRRAGIDADITQDIRTAMWRKFMFICAHAGMTAAARLPVGPLREDPAAWRMYERVVAEVRDVAAAEGIVLGADAVDATMALARDLEPGVYSSLHYDLEHGKPMELDSLNGYVTALGRQHDIPVPANEAIYSLLSPFARRNGASTSSSPSSKLRGL